MTASVAYWSFEVSDIILTFLKSSFIDKGYLRWR